jgi:adenylosuccinate lyase
MQTLEAISPIDGRYRNKTEKLAHYFSESALIKYRLIVELRYLKFLKSLNFPQLINLDKEILNDIENEINQLKIEHFQEIKDIEKITNHDVKAVEYYLKKIFDNKGLSVYKEWIHFGLTSQDINNTAVPMSIKDAMDDIIYPALMKLHSTISELGDQWMEIPMLARTHGQPASPTILGKEIQVFSSRLLDQIHLMKKIPYRAKFGGATGNFNAHYLAFPEIDWPGEGKRFVQEFLGLERTSITTQIEPYDMLAAFCHSWIRINNILIDFSRDVWTYISMEYFTQKTVEGEIGSSAMPHKVNPIDFENAEGNLGIANAIYNHLANKLPISRLQRDLTDSTVLRNIGVPLAHNLIAFSSLIKGISKLNLNLPKLKEDLNNNWAVLAEAIQTILRREGVDQPYEKLKALTRGKGHIDKGTIHAFIDQLDVDQEIKKMLRGLSPEMYTGTF